MKRRFVVVLLLGFAALLALALALSPRVYMLSSGSMRPTLVPGDIVVCVEGLSVDRGDIVAVNSPTNDVVSAKRVIALPSDEVAYINKILTINGVDVEKTLVGELSPANPMDLVFEQSLGKRSFQILEAFGQSLSSVSSMHTDGYFLLGDNRDGSTDSRHFGPVEETRLKCKLVAILATESSRGFSLKRAELL